MKTHQRIRYLIVKNQKKSRCDIPIQIVTILRSTTHVVELHRKVIQYGPVVVVNSKVICRIIFV